MVPDNVHEFFTASAGVAGALIGLLFVAISVAGERLSRAAAAGQIHRIRANAALVSFNNALAISLFALVPGQKIGWTAVAVGAAGATFVIACLVSLVRARVRQWSTVRDALFLVGLAIVFVIQVASGFNVLAHPEDDGDYVDTIAFLVIFCFIIGISRAWELIGGPTIGLRHELYTLVREHIPTDEADKTAEPAEARETAEPVKAGEARRAVEVSEVADGAESAEAGRAPAAPPERPAGP